MVHDLSDSNSEMPIPDEIEGLRMTRQRREVYRVLMTNRDHPTANDVFLRVKDSLPNISLATVYNCLEVLVQHGIVRQVNFDRNPSRFCPNLEEHGHFHDESTGAIHDVTFKPGVNLADLLDLPPGTVISDVEITLRGELPSSTPSH
ncbi:transcriptional repressor [Luteolibacter ambystomatis]|uniref:Transcriptional repressor n=2 Tax=Luteolibacter ambystomatis TaxID=2824561 RepID=A0A975G8B7_9BACT|nr:transcriptional repressor [Luteolibacter ambystomatis]